MFLCFFFLILQITTSRRLTTTRDPENMSALYRAVDFRVWLVVVMERRDMTVFCAGIHFASVHKHGLGDKLV